MIRVVFDTNILVSALLFGGTPEAVLLAASSGAFPLCSSPALEAELLEVLEERFQWDRPQLRKLRQRLGAIWTLFEPTEEITACSDSDDNRVLECAVESRASHIITGDAALLKLDPFREIRIVRAADFRRSSLAQRRPDSLGGVSFREHRCGREDGDHLKET